MGFVVRRTGVYSLLVDAGRPGWQHLGVPRGGPADRSAWQLGNALVGNDPNTTALEITLQGPNLEATGRHRLVVHGAAFAVKHWKAAAREMELVPPGHVFTVDSGDEVQLPRLTGQHGVRAYVCVQGGFQTETLLGSQTALDPLKTSQQLACVEARGSWLRWIRLDPWPDAPPRGRLRLLPGAHLTRSLRKQLLATAFRVSQDSNRMGVRLTSSAQWPAAGRELLSAPVVPGTVQLPGGGQPIVLGVDAQTIGGYRQLGHVITADLDRLGQLRPGETVHFQCVTLDQAEALRDSHDRWLRQWLERLRYAC